MIAFDHFQGQNQFRSFCMQRLDQLDLEAMSEQVVMFFSNDQDLCSGKAADDLFKRLCLCGSTVENWK